MKNFTEKINKNTIPRGINLIEEKEQNIQSLDKIINLYLKSISERGERLSVDKVRNISNKKNINEDNRISRIEESRLQNQLLSLFSNNKYLNFDIVSVRIRKILAEKKYDNIRMLSIQKNIDLILAGIESCLEAVNSLNQENKKLINDGEINNAWIGTNDILDANYQIDLIRGMEANKDNDEDILNLDLVQVKSSEPNAIFLKNIFNSHVDYLSNLPKVIGLINLKESDKLVEKELMEEYIVLDTDRKREIEDQISLFGLVLEEYFKNIKERNKNPNIKELFDLYKIEGGTMNPFTFVGIIKNNKILNFYRQAGYFNGDLELEKKIKDTAYSIPYEEEESLAFYKKYHQKTILDATTINSVVMVKGKKVSVVKIENPLKNK